MKKLRTKMMMLLIAASMASKAQEPKVFDAIVAADGSGDYTTIQEAINKMNPSDTRPYLIFIKNGSYTELIDVPEDKVGLHLIGQDPEKTIIRYTLHCGGPNDKEYLYSVNNPESPAYKHHATAEIAAPDFYAEGITFENTYGVSRQNGPQALAIRTMADRQALYNCRLRSFQDTWFTSPEDQHRQYVKNCWIEGAVDYMYGGGDILVEQSTFYNVRSGSVITAPCHKENAKYGYVMRDCIVDGNTNATNGRQLLGRPWHNAPITIWINTTMRIPIAPQGWTNMGAIPKLFAEYGSHDEKGNLLDLSQRKTAYEYTIRPTGDKVSGQRTTTISKQDADSLYTYQNMICSNDGWNPRQLMLQLPAPSKVRITRHQISWEPVINAIGYLVTDDKENVIAITKKCRCNINDSSKQYRVRSISESGSIGL